MNPAVGLAVTLRVRMGVGAAYHPNGVVDASQVLSLFGDVARELLIRLDGDEGLFRGFQQVEVLTPIFVGDYIEATGVITKVAGTMRQFAFEARKVITYVRSATVAETAADALASPAVVARAVGTCTVARALQRRPRLVLPALPAHPGQVPEGGKLPQGHVVVTPPPHVIVTPPRETPPEVIVAASLIGGGVRREHTPHIPVTPDEIAAEAKRCCEAGASVIYLSVDDPAPSTEQLTEQLQQYVQAVRSVTDAVLIVSTVAPGAPELERRLPAAPADLLALCPGTFNLGDAVVQTPRPLVRELTQALQQRAVPPMLECYEVGHLDEALILQRERLLTDPLRVQLVLGVPGAMGASDETLRFLASRMPPSACWFAAGVGRHQRRVSELAVRLGGHARVGLGDNIYLRKGVLAEGSAPLVDRIVSYARSIGRQPVGPDRARALMGLGSNEPQVETQPSEPSPAEAQPPTQEQAVE